MNEIFTFQTSEGEFMFTKLSIWERGERPELIMVDDCSRLYRHLEGTIYREVHFLYL